MKLPQKYWAQEGKMCFIIANSWGKGWGLGGHACLTETWVQNHIFAKLSYVDQLAIN